MKLYREHKRHECNEWWIIKAVFLTWPWWCPDWRSRPRPRSWKLRAEISTASTWRQPLLAGPVLSGSLRQPEGKNKSNAKKVWLSSNKRTRLSCFFLILKGLNICIFAVMAHHGFVFPHLPGLVNRTSGQHEMIALRWGETPGLAVYKQKILQSSALKLQQIPIVISAFLFQLQEIQPSFR